MNRRKFLTLLGAISIFPSLALGKPKRKVSRGTVLLLLMPDGEPHSHLVTVNSQGKNWQRFPLPLPRGFISAHSIETNPRDPAELVILPRQHDTGVLFSLREGKIRKEIKAREGHVFAGHGLFLPDGSRVLISEIRTDGSAEGFISIRDSRTGEIVEELYTGAKQPHHLVAVDPQMNMLGVTHYGEEFGPVSRDLHSEVTFVDWKTRQVVQRFKKSTHVNAELCHLVVNPRNQDDFFVSAHDHIRIATNKKAETIHDVAKFFPAPVYWGSRSGGKLGELNDEGNRDHFLFNFSIAMSGKHDTFGLVHQIGDRLSFWDCKTKKLRKILSFSREHDGFLGGLNTTSDQDEFFYSVTNGKTGRSKVVFMDAKSLTTIRSLELPYLGKLTAHMGWSDFQA